MVELNDSFIGKEFYQGAKYKIISINSGSKTHPVQAVCMANFKIYKFTKKTILKLVK